MISTGLQMISNGLGLSSMIVDDIQWFSDDLQLLLQCFPIDFGHSGNVIIPRDRLMLGWFPRIHSRFVRRSPGIMTFRTPGKMTLAVSKNAPGMSLFQETV